jgi:hypothetical protein
VRGGPKYIIATRGLRAAEALKSTPAHTVRIGNSATKGYIFEQVDKLYSRIEGRRAYKLTHAQKMNISQSWMQRVCRLNALTGTL